MSESHETDCSAVLVPLGLVVVDERGRKVFAVFYPLPCFKYNVTTYANSQASPVSQAGETDRSSMHVRVSPSP